MELNLHIRDLRKGRGYTIAQLADIVGISTPHLSEVERGKKNLNNHLLTRIATALDVKPETLIASDADADLVSLNVLMSGLAPEDRQRVCDFADALYASQQETKQNQ